MKIFSKVKYIEDNGIQNYNICKSWVDLCDGKEVVDGICMPGQPYHNSKYYICDEWCIKVPDTQLKAKTKERHKYQIIIESDGDTTTATMTINGVEVKKAQTKRNPKDKPNWKIGAQMAFGRLWDTEKKKNTVKADTLNCRCVVKMPPQFREVKRHAKNGEYIKIVKPIADGGYYKKGDIRRVRKQGTVFNDLVYIDGSPKSVDDVEYVVLEGMAEHVAGGGKHE